MQMIPAKIKVALLLSLLFFSQCNNPCGALTGVEKDMVNVASLKYDSLLTVENIPCESSYINVKGKTEITDTSTINDLHKMLYNNSTKKGWVTLLIFDRQGNYLYSHSLIQTKFTANRRLGSW